MARKRKNKINSIVAPLTPRGMKREINAETRQKFGEVGRDLRGDLRASGQDIRNTNSWFTQYQNRMAPVRAEQNTGTANLQQSMRDNASYMSGWNQNQSQATGAAEDRSAAIRGAVADPTAASRDEAADTQRQALLASSRDRAAQIGESTGGYLRGVTAASELGRQADVRGIRNTIAETRSKQRTLSREKGDFRITRASEKRGEERDWNIQRRTLNANIANDRGRLALARQTENRIASEGSSGGPGGSGGSKGSKGGGGGVSSKDLRQAVAYTREAIRGTPGAEWGDWRGLQSAKVELIDGLINRGVDPAAARAAYRTLLTRWKNNRGGRPSKPGRGDYR